MLQLQDEDMPKQVRGCLVHTHTHVWAYSVNYAPPGLAAYDQGPQWTDGSRPDEWAEGTSGDYYL